MNERLLRPCIAAGRVFSGKMAATDPEQTLVIPRIDAALLQSDTEPDKGITGESQ